MGALKRSALSLVLGVSALLGVAGQSSAADRVKIGFLKITVTAPLWLADEKGWFASEDLQPEFVEFDSQQPIVAALLSGDIDIGVAGLSAGFYNAAEHGALRIIAGGVSEHPGFQGAGFAASSTAHEAGLRSMKDLPGHSLAIPAVGTPQHYAFWLFAQKYRFDMESVRLVQAGTLGNVAAAVTGGSVDAGGSSATSLKPAIERGSIFLLAWVGDEFRLQAGASFTTAATADDKRDLLQRFLRVYNRGVAEYRAAFNGRDDRREDGPTAPAMYDLLAKHLNLPVETVKLGVGYLAPDLAVDAPDVMRQIAWYKAHAMVKPDVDGTKIIDTRFVVLLPRK
jgi:NitT/TauT family transport system substrate-binding protein